MQPNCDKCNNEKTALHKCARCLEKNYCSAECQRVDWPEHKKVCCKTPGKNTVMLTVIIYKGVIVNTNDIGNVDKQIGNYTYEMTSSPELKQANPTAKSCWEISPYTPLPKSTPFTLVFIIDGDASIKPIATYNGLKKGYTELVAFGNYNIGIHRTDNKFSDEYQLYDVYYVKF
jgi:hypothetical protein